MTGTKEFYELREQFEKNIQESSIRCNLERVGKDEKVPAGIFYHDGLTNLLFKVYIMGYRNAKCLFNIGAN
jgi:hypothetical protein